MKTNEQTYIDLEKEDIRKYTRRGFISGLAALTGIAMIGDLFSLGTEKSEIAQNYQNAKQTLQNLREEGFVDVNSYPEHYKNKELDEFLKNSGEYNKSLESAIISSKIDISELEKNPKIIKIKSKLKRDFLKFIGEFVGGVVMTIGGIEYANDYFSYAKHSKNKLKKFEENRK